VYGNSITTNTSSPVGGYSNTLLSNNLFSQITTNGILGTTTSGTSLTSGVNHYAGTPYDSGTSQGFVRGSNNW